MNVSQFEPITTIGNYVLSRYADTVRVKSMANGSLIGQATRTPLGVSWGVGGHVPDFIVRAVNSEFGVVHV